MNRIKASEIKPGFVNRNRNERLKLKKIDYSRKNLRGGNGCSYFDERVKIGATI